ncbi:MAG: CorA family divalent cation transporter [Erysipelotrichaceae bacterium]|uniref:magnesium transporter CorA family protein n=1 Tax=Floccifex sp. TaxID=2815810 RepID=UPI0029FED1DE|nr:CorA family divalent cation transporter [Floccifex sp.]MDD7282030.1 CorA family divalent cation transporter [Erysipelotrichaceae bacterium]MDY2957865.1 CorA family divalent cation transporter [Floccifex sp.]
MQKIIAFEKADELFIYIDESKSKLLKEHINSHKMASFELYPQFYLCSFNWYDINSPETNTNRVIIYFDLEDLLIFCENEQTKQKLQPFLASYSQNDKTLHHFLFSLLENDMDYLDDYEDVITDAEDEALKGHYRGYLEKIQEYRKELLRLKRYYTQLQVICDGLIDNENNLISEHEMIHFNILHNRVDRCYAAVLNLHDYITQMREAYQSQIDIEQNQLMKFFTLVTALFLPLTLMVGWYGMNFKNMPELSSPLGYPIFIIVSILICVALLIYFKKKKWF